MQMAKQLVAKGARVIVAGRSQARVSEAVTALGPSAQGEIVDLASFSSSELSTRAVSCTLKPANPYVQSRSLQPA